MSTVYGRKAYSISSTLVSSIAVTGGTVLSSGDVNGSFEVRFRHDLGGCGSADSGIFVQLLDFTAWTMMAVQFELLGSASCWSFNTSGYGNAVGNSGTGNMLTYSEAAGDKCVKTYLAQNDSPYTTHDKVSACDNNADNFMVANTGVYRKCTFIRRRNVNGSLAGPHHGRSCNASGAGAITVIKNIYVW